MWEVALSDIEVDYSENKSRGGQPITPESVESLAESMRDNGQDTPVKIRANRSGDKPYRLYVGYRRATAAKSLGWPSISATLSEVTDEQAAFENLRENLERKDLTYFEECVALKDLFPADAGVKTIADRVNRSRHWVRCRWQVWELEPEILLGVETGDLTPSDIAVMLGKSREEQLATAETIRLGKAKGETRDEIAAKLGRKATRPNKQQIGHMLTLMEQNDRQEAKFALLWANGDIDSEEFLDYTKCKASEAG